MFHHAEVKNNKKVERRNRMDYNKIEDAVMKSALSTFSQSAVDFFGIKKKIIAPSSTEIKNIEINTNYTDYTFYTEDGNYLHFEFQTTNKENDMRRFLFYDASLVYRDRRKIDTIVVYSSEIENVNTFLDAGSIKYSAKAFYMKDMDGDSTFEKIKEKVEKGCCLNDSEMLSLTLVPLMNSTKSKSERAADGIKLADKIKDSENKLQCLSMLYALLDKFGDEDIKKNIWEVFNMTEIGRLIMEEGIKKGKEEGIKEGKEAGVKEGKKEGKEQGLKEGKTETLLKLLVKRFGKIPQEYKESIQKLPVETIDIISLEIFDMKEIKDIEKYL